MLMHAIRSAEKHSLLASYPACFAMLEADNLVVLGRLVYVVPALAIAIAEEAAELINIQLRKLQELYESEDGPCFHLHVNTPYTVFVSGAGRRRPTLGAGDVNKSTPDAKRGRKERPLRPSEQKLDEVDEMLQLRPAEGHGKHFSSNAAVHVIQFSTDPACAARRGRSQVYKVDSGAQHTVEHLAQQFAIGLAVDRAQICLMTRQVSYHDSLFHRPMYKRATVSLLYLHVLDEGASVSSNTAPSVVEDIVNGAQDQQTGSRADQDGLAFAPTKVALDSLGQCLSWLVGSLRSRWLHPVHFRLEASQWMFAARRNHYLVAGHCIDDLASGHGMNAFDYIHYYWNPHHCRAPLVLFTWVFGCLYDLSIAVFSSQGDRVDGTWQVWHSVRSLSYGNVGVSISPTVPFLEFTQVATDDEELSAVSALDKPTLMNEKDVTDGSSTFRTGGVRGPQPKRGAGQVKADTAKVKRADAHGANAGTSARLSHALFSASDVYLPPWSLTTGEEEMEQATLHVSVGKQAPITICVPTDWSSDLIEDALLQHVGAQRSWVDFTWVGSDLHVEYSAGAPSLKGDTAERLLALFQSLPRAASHRRALSRTTEVIIGHRASRLPGISAFTQAQPEYSCEVVKAVSDVVPDATFNAIALVSHSNSPAHRDGFNSDELSMFLLPQAVSDTAWLWFEATHGTAEVEVDGEVLLGSWVPYNKVYCFPGTRAHQIDSAEDIGTVVLYSTARVPARKHILQAGNSGPGTSSKTSYAPWRQGGGRIQKVQHSATSQSACRLVLEDLGALPAGWNTQQVAQLLERNRKCTLACFQAKGKSQRLRALAAGFQRSGFVEHAQYLLCIVSGEQKQALTTSGLRFAPPQDDTTSAPSVEVQAEQSGASIIALTR
eukprot:3286271-Amphidinium_carterae.2